MYVRRLPIVLLMFALPALGLVACDDAEPETLTKDEARTLLENLPDGMADVEQVKFEMRGTFAGLDQIPPEELNADGATVDPQNFGMVFAGGIDVPNKQAHMRFEVTGFSLNPDDPSFEESFGDTFSEADPEDFGLFMEMKAFADRSYMRGLIFSLFTGAPPAQWVLMDDEDDGGSFFNEDEAIEPTELVSFIDAIEGDIEVIGNEEVRGAEATHVRFTARVGELDELTGGDFGTFTFDEDAGPLPVDAWIDTEGRLHRVEITGPVGDSLDFGDGETAADYDITGTLAFWLWDYGKPIDLDAPADDEVVNADDLEGGLFGAFEEDEADADSATPEAEPTELTEEQQRYTDLMLALLSNLDDRDMETLRSEHPDLANRLDNIMVSTDDEVTADEVAELEDLIADIEEALGVDIPDAP
jgi:hypothetical protein